METLIMKKNFIKATEGYCDIDRHVAAPLLRKTFELDFVPESATVSICGLGFYRFFVNGKEITKGHIAPYISNPDHICYYDTYDVRELLNMGKNVFGVILGNGFMNPFGALFGILKRRISAVLPSLRLSFLLWQVTERLRSALTRALRPAPRLCFSMTSVWVRYMMQERKRKAGIFPTLTTPTGLRL